MDIEFSKMHGAGNDFIVIEKSKLPKGFLLSKESIIKFCCRKLGVGADGLMILKNEPASDYDFQMVFFNSDGGRETMCGNGLRCASLYAYKYFGKSSTLRAMTDSGLLMTEIVAEDTVRIEIPYLQEFKQISVDGVELYFGDTGVHHAVLFVDDNKSIDVVKEGRYLRNHKAFGMKGTNVNFVSQLKDPNSEFIIRTYERGVEDETLACGTGISAAAICAHIYKNAGNRITFQTTSGQKLFVEIPKEETFDKVFLTGPAIEVYRGITLCQL